MPRIGREPLFIFCLFAGALPAFAQDPKPLPAIPPGNFQFEGAWDCAGAMGNGKTHKSAFTGSVILGGKWLELVSKTSVVNWVPGDHLVCKRRGPASR
ncbi:MAG: hypothetical protein ABSH24_23175 [Bryobacteraceae bacterium]|jgi:hypothetical protein